MTQGSRYVKIVEWSDEDDCFVGSCPELFYGGCHGDDERRVFDELCRRIDEVIELYRSEERDIPPPMENRGLVNQLQKIA